MPARRIALASFLILLFAVAALAQDDKPPSFTNPEDDTDPRMRIEADTWVLPFPGLEIRVTYLEAGTHSIFLEERAPDIVDPFTPDGLFPGEHYLFRIDMTNRSKDDITFHPGNVMIITNQKERELPLEYSDFYRRLMYDAATSPERWLKRWVDVYWDGSNTLYPGDSSSKLIAFRAPRDRC